MVRARSNGLSKSNYLRELTCGHLRFPYREGLDRYDSALEMFTFTAQIWLHSDDTPWHFVTLPSGMADEIAADSDKGHRGFGSVRVVATIGETTWSTSIFPDSKVGSFVLPVKKAVRKSESLSEGDEVSVSVVVTTE